MLKINFFRKDLKFKSPAGTSRGVLYEKPSWIFYVEEAQHIRGECSVIPGLSLDYESEDQFENKIKWVCQTFNSLIQNEDQFKVLSFFSNELKAEFSAGREGISINGLIWMGSSDEMLSQIGQKLDDGYAILKLKIGAIELFKELEILKNIRDTYGKKLEIRVDANGAFGGVEVRDILYELKKYDIHSIEQPIEKGNWKLMKALCNEAIIPIALDEELIGINLPEKKKELLQTIRPQFIILKPSLHGGVYGCSEWIEMAESMNIDWWLTSALESNIGLEMIARFAAHYKPKIAQGLGTGGLFTNNFPSPLFIESGKLFLNNEKR
ncbi:MAG: o-succinylbenzoate synthase [Crocinitomicaceae bacterium]